MHIVPRPLIRPLQNGYWKWAEYETTMVQTSSLVPKWYCEIFTTTEMKSDCHSHAPIWRAQLVILHYQLEDSHWWMLPDSPLHSLWRSRHTFWFFCKDFALSCRQIPPSQILGGQSLLHRNRLELEAFATRFWVQTPNSPPPFGVFD